jgi:hypothetical protein
MVGASVNGLLGVDAELQRSAVAAKYHTFEDDSVRVLAPRQDTWNCPSAQPSSRNLS